MLFRRRRWIGALIYTALAPHFKSSDLHAETNGKYAEKILLKQPVAYWPLGNKAGTTVIDASKHGHDGSLNGASVTEPVETIKNGRGGAIRFDGKSDFIEVPDHPDFSIATSGEGLTVEAWMRPDSLEFPGQTDDPYVMWLGKGDAGKYEWGLRFYSRKSSRPNRISAYSFNAGGGLGAGAYFEDKLAVGECMHIVAIFSPGDMRDPKAGVSIFRNGKLRQGPAMRGASGTLYRSYDVVPAHGDSPLRLGTVNRKSFLTGALADIAIYPRALTAPQILDHYRTGIGGRKDPERRG
jgi:hypothetical protein